MGTITGGSSAVTTDTVSFTAKTYASSPANYYLNDLVIKVDTQTVSTLVTETAFSVLIDLTCSSGGSIVPAYTLSGYNGEAVPSWVTLDSISGRLSGTAPSVSEQTTYSFYVDTTSTLFIGAKKKLVSLVVKLPSKLILSSEATATSTTTTAAVAAGVGASVASASLNASNPTAVWSLMNQLQLLILLLLVDTYIPDDVQGFIQGQDFAMFSFDFIPSTKIPYIKIPTDWMEFEQSNEVLKDLGVASRSTFNNSFSLILVIIGIIALHVFIKILPKYKGSEEGKRGK